MHEIDHPGPAPMGIELVLPCWWEGIGATRRFIVSYLKPLVRSEAECERVALAAHELLENAVKHCTGPAGTIVCRVSLTDEAATVRVTNPARPDDVKRLARELDLAMAGDDPLENYVSMMGRHLDAPERSQIGLARIRYESRASLSMSAGMNRVSVTARLALAA